jgi:hypothetical protein
MAGIAFVWQGREVRRLRGENAALQKDLKAVLASGLETISPTNVAQREKLELIKLRNEVRELKESIADEHASKPGKIGDLLSSLLPATTPSPIKYRPEWKGMEGTISNIYVQAMQRLEGVTNEYARYANLPQAAKASFAVGRTDDAREYVSDMFVLDEKYSRGSPEKSNGDVIYNGNLILGRIALDEGRIEDAKKYLLAAGKCTGSSVLGNFGPNMSLANELLHKGEQEVVLEFFELVRKFWKSDKLDEWIKDVHAGRIPEFGANLLY